MCALVHREQAVSHDSEYLKERIKTGVGQQYNEAEPQCLEKYVRKRDGFDCYTGCQKQVSHQRWIWGTHCMQARKHKQASILGFETQDRRHHKSATSLRDTCGHTKRININVIQIKETKKPYGIALGSR